jgi:hypothetical protein
MIWLPLIWAIGFIIAIMVMVYALGYEGHKVETSDIHPILLGAAFWPLSATIWFLVWLNKKGLERG